MKKPPALVLPPPSTTKTSTPALSAAALLGRASGSRSGLAGARVLVVEDDKECRELIRVFLERAAATVFCVDSVAAAMDCVYSSFDPDVVLTDYSMPVANGLEFIRQFRKAPSSRAIAVPIIVISGHSEENWRARSWRPAEERGRRHVLRAGLSCRRRNERGRFQWRAPGAKPGRA